MATFPAMATVRQFVPTAPLPDVAQAVRDELQRIDVATYIVPGARIAVAAGSRGITDYALIVRTVVDELRQLRAEPFVFPAMGSHGGATAEGQREVLAEQGITPDTMGCPVLTAMDVVRVGTTPRGLPVFCDANAYGSDGIIVVNRVKVHTDFHGRTESGLTKMLAIGLGKRQGAELLHQGGVRGLREDIPEVAAVHLQASPILFGVAIVEDGAHNVSYVQAVPAHDIPHQEPLILERARSLIATLPLPACDLLIVDEIGKDISGAGFDSNVIGRMLIEGEAEPVAPRCGLIAALRLTPASHGNAAGIGFADFVSQPLLDAMDAEVTSINILTSGFLLRGHIPHALPDDRATIGHALEVAAKPSNGRGPTVFRIRNTLSLSELQASENMLPELLAQTNTQIVMPPAPMQFRADGSLI